MVWPWLPAPGIVSSRFGTEEDYGEGRNTESRVQALSLHERHYQQSTIGPCMLYRATSLCHIIFI